MKNITKVTGLLLIFILIISVVAGCGKKDSETASTKAKIENGKQLSGHTADTVKIGFVDVTGTGVLSDTLGIARDRGFVEEELKEIGVTAEFIPMTGAGPAINEALASKSLDVGFLGDVPAIIGKAAGVDTQIISLSGSKNGASIVIPKDSGYKTVADLKGKKIATMKGSFMHKVFLDILKANKMEIDDIEFVNVNAQGAAEALVAGNVEGAVVGGSTLTKLINDGYGEVLVDYREHPEWNCGSYGVARTKYIEENPDIINALLKALVRAQKLATQDNTVSLQQWVSTGDSESSYKYLYPNSDNVYDIKKSDEIITSGKATIKFLLDNELITDGFNFEDWINSNFYEAAYSELGE